MKKKLILTFILLSFITISFAASLKPSKKFRLWSISENVNYEKMIFKHIELPAKNRSLQGVLDYIYKGNNSFHFKVIYIKNKTAYVSIEGDADIVTQRSGSTGGIHYALTVLYNLTEFEHIQYVYFLDEGDHFLSGKFERLDFWQYMSDFRKKKSRKLVEERLSAHSEKLYTYIKALAEIGDQNSIKKLQTLKKDLNDKHKYRLEQIDSSIKEIKKRIKN